MTHTSLGGPDAYDIPKGDGTKDRDTIHRSLEVEMEQVIRELVDHEQRVARCGRCEAYVRVTKALKTLVTT